MTDELQGDQIRVRSEVCDVCDGKILYKDLIIKLVVLHRECFMHGVMKRYEKEVKRDESH